MAKKLDLKQLAKEEAQVAASLSLALVGFKPEFGNEAHISLCRQLADIADMRKELERKINASAGGQKLAQDLISKQTSLLTRFAKK